MYLRNKLRTVFAVLAILIPLLVSGGSTLAQKQDAPPIPGAFKGPAPTMSCGPDFSDVPPSSITYYAAVQFVYCHGIMDAPYGDGTFRPNDYFYQSSDPRKGQVAKVVALATNHTPVATCTGSQIFYEDNLNDGLCNYVEAIGYAFTEGAYYPAPERDFYFCQPNYWDPYPCWTSGGKPLFDHAQVQIRDFDVKTYIDVATFSLTGTIPQQFVDVPPGSYGYNAISIAKYAGIIPGFTCGSPGLACTPPANLPYFLPDYGMTRGQMAQMIYKRQSIYPTYP